MTTRPLLLLLGVTASFAILPFSVFADDLLDAVLRSDYPAAQPAAMTSPAPAPATSPAFTSPDAPALPEAALPPPAADETIGSSSTSRHSRTAARSRGASKKTFERQLMEAFAGCCFFVRPKPPEKPSPDEDEPQIQPEYLP